MPTNRPYRFGRIYGVLNLLGAVFNTWLGIAVLLRGYVWVAALSALLTLVSCGSGIGLLRKRRYGFFLLNFSIAIGIAANIYGWFQPSEFRPFYHLAANAAFFVSMAIIFAYFYKRRSEFT
jgi:hypothetical protein